MRTLKELEEVEREAWPRVRSWLDRPARSVGWRLADDQEGREALVELQVTLASPLGAVVRHTTGISIEDGWIKVLGCGRYGISEWVERGTGRGWLVVAYDACGGFYALDAGGLRTGRNKIAYLSPETLEWEPLNLAYGTFLHRLLRGELEERYTRLQWDGWQGDVMGLPPNMVIAMKPPLWAKNPEEGERQRHSVYVGALWRHVAKLAKTLGRPWSRLVLEG